MSLPKVTIQIVTWNSIKFLPECLKSIFDQTHKDFQVLIIDNNSQDGSVEFVKKNYPAVAVFQNKKNLGFAKANNQGIKLLHSPYVVLCNPDIILTADWLEKIMAKAESENFADFGSFGGKLLKLKLIDGEIDEEGKTDLIDSCGLQILKNRRMVEIGAGQNSCNFADKKEILGHSGALVLYKRETLDDLLIKTKENPSGEYFDEDFFFYKEDVDLAWRAQIFGWKSIFVPEAVAYHVRSASGSENIGLGEMIKNRKKQSSLTRYYSYRNHLLVLIKNEFSQNFIRNFWRIKFFEAKKFGYILFFEIATLKTWWDIFKLLPKMLRKRKEIKRKAKIGYSYFARFIK